MMISKNTGTFVKLQESYAAENNAVGSWIEIGYKGPGSQASNSSKSSTFSYTQNGSTKGTWKATASVALNDCTTGVWTVKTTYDSGNVTTAANVSDAAKCKNALTPNFCKIATTGDCSTTF